MKQTHKAWLGVALTVALLVPGCSAGLFGLGSPAKRTHNIELTVLSQSCLFGEVVPCG